MTEKRFKVYKVIGSFHEWSIEDSFDDKVVFNSIMHKYNADRLCGKLNELHEENQRLKAFIKRLTNNCGEIILMNGMGYNVDKILGDLE